MAGKEGSKQNKGEALQDFKTIYRLNHRNFGLINTGAVFYSVTNAFSQVSLH